jgi:hypothetical protein
MQRATNIIDHIGYFVTVVAIGLIAITVAGPVLVDTEAVTASTCTAGTYQQGGACVALPTPASADTTAVQDAASEGQDVLTLDYSASPTDLWDALRNMGYRGVPNDGLFGMELERLYVPTGTAIDVPGGLYLATVDGWMQCRDSWQEQECSATGPVHLTDIPWHGTTFDVPTADPFGGNGTAVCGTDAQCRAWDHAHGITEHDLPIDPSDPHDAGKAGKVHNVAHSTALPSVAPVTAGERQAARALLKRLHAGRPIFEDFTYRGAPRVVGQNNDALVDRWQATGRPNVHKFLHAIARGEVPQKVIPRRA